MERRDLIVNNKKGIHIRVASLLVQTANKFQCSVYLEKESEKVSCKSIMSLMMLGVTCGTPVALYADGDDEKTAIETISKLIEGNFEE